MTLLDTGRCNWSFSAAITLEHVFQAVSQFISQRLIPNHSWHMKVNVAATANKNIYIYIYSQVSLLEYLTFVLKFPRIQLSRANCFVFTFICVLAQTQNISSSGFIAALNILMQPEEGWLPGFMKPYSP